MKKELLLSLAVMAVFSSISHPCKALGPSKNAKQTFASVKEVITNSLTMEKYLSDDGKELYLDDLGLTSLEGLGDIPHPEAITKIALDDNALTDIPSGTFDRFPNLFIVGLRDNKLRQISPKLFKKNPKIGAIDLRGNPLDEVIIDFLKALPDSYQYWYKRQFNSIKELMQSGTYDGRRHHSYGRDTLDFTERGLTSLEGLEDIENPEAVDAIQLGDNTITDIPKGAFDRFVNLKSLLLGSNPIEKLPDGLFDTLEKLEYLSISETNIAEFPPNTFAKVPLLKHLDLGANQLREVHPELVRHQTQMTDFWLSENPLKSLPANLLITNTQLQDIYLYDCELQEIPVELIAYKSQLESVWVEGNPLTDESREELEQHPVFFKFKDAPRVG